MAISIVVDSNAAFDGVVFRATMHRNTVRFGVTREVLEDLNGAGGLDTHPDQLRVFNRHQQAIALAAQRSGLFGRADQRDIYPIPRSMIDV